MCTILVGFFLWFRDYALGEMGFGEAFWYALLQWRTIYILILEFIIKYIFFRFSLKHSHKDSWQCAVICIGIYYSYKLANPEKPFKRIFTDPINWIIEKMKLKTAQGET